MAQSYDIQGILTQVLGRAPTAEEVQNAQRIIDQNPELFSDPAEGVSNIQKIGKNILSVSQPQAPTPTPTVEDQLKDYQDTVSPSTYYQDVEQLNQGNYSQALNYLEQSWNLYKTAYDEDLKAYGPQERKTFQAALTKASEGLSARGLAGSGIEAANTADISQAREYAQGVYQRGKQQELAQTQMGYEKQKTGMSYAYNLSRLNLEKDLADEAENAYANPY